MNVFTQAISPYEVGLERLRSEEERLGRPLSWTEAVVIIERVPHLAVDSKEMGATACLETMARWKSIRIVGQTVTTTCNPQPSERR